MKFASVKKILLMALCITFVSCSGGEHIEEKTDSEVIVVRIPPFHDPSLTPLQNFYAFQHFLYPVAGEPAIKQVKGDTGTRRDLPYDHSLLHVKLSETGEISINSEPQASIDVAVKRLSDIFANRTKMGVYAPGTDEAVKAVGIRVPHSAKYAELIQIAKAMKESGADPIVLLLDGHLPYQITEGSTR